MQHAELADGVCLHEVSDAQAMVMCMCSSPWALIMHGIEI